MDAGLAILAVFAALVWFWGEWWGARKLARARRDLAVFSARRASWR